jgi:hypothetical protein
VNQDETAGILPSININLFTGENRSKKLRRKFSYLS